MNWTLLVGLTVALLSTRESDGYYTGGACPHNCRCTARGHDRSSHLRKMYMNQWIQQMYRYGQKKGFSQTNQLDDGREMVCLGLQRLPYYIPAGKIFSIKMFLILSVPKSYPLILEIHVHVFWKTQNDANFGNVRINYYPRSTHTKWPSFLTLSMF
jgi:hypothetical protein